jgi:hypothetical protein
MFRVRQGENVRDHVIRILANWIETRLTGKRADRGSVVEFLAMLSPEERSGVYKLRTFYQRYNRGRSDTGRKARGRVMSYGPRQKEVLINPLHEVHRQAVSILRPVLGGE